MLPDLLHCVNSGIKIKMTEFVKGKNPFFRACRQIAAETPPLQASGIPFLSRKFNNIIRKIAISGNKKIYRRLMETERVILPGPVNPKKCPGYLPSEKT